MDLGTQFVDSGHQPPLLCQRRQGHYVAENISRADGCIVGRSLRRDLFTERRSADEVVEKPTVELGLVDLEQEVVAANDGSIERHRHDTETANLGVDLCDKELARAANL